MPPTDMSVAVNARVVPTAEYGTDPNGVGMFQRLSAVLQRGISGAGQIAITRRSNEFHGYAANPQPAITGQARLLGAGIAVSDANPELADAKSSGVDPALSIFRQRMMRRQG